MTKTSKVVLKQFSALGTSRYWHYYFLIIFFTISQVKFHTHASTLQWVRCRASPVLLYYWIMSMAFLLEANSTIFHCSCTVNMVHVINSLEWDHGRSPLESWIFGGYISYSSFFPTGAKEEANSQMLVTERFLENKKSNSMFAKWTTLFHFISLFLRHSTRHLLGCLWALLFNHLLGSVKSKRTGCFQFVLSSVTTSNVHLHYEALLFCN